MASLYGQGSVEFSTKVYVALRQRMESHCTAAPESGGNKKNDPDRLEMNKYCRFCKKHTAHRETR